MDVINQKRWTPRALFLFIFGLVFIYLRAYENFTFLVTRAIIPALFIVGVLMRGKAIFSATRFYRHPVYQAYFLLFLWSLVTFAVVTNVSNFLRYSQLFAGILMMGTVILAFVRTRNDVRAFSLGFVVGVVAIVIDTYLQGELSSSLSDLDKMSRASGIAGNANTFGAIILLGVFLSMVVKQLFGLRFWIFVLLNGLFFFAILQTASRSSMFGFVLLHAMHTFLVYKKMGSLSRLGVILLSFGLLVILLPQIQTVYNTILDNTFLGYRIQRNASSSDQIRYELLNDGIEMIEKNPILGVGSGNFVDNTPLRMYSHNDFIELISTTGIVGLLFYLMFLRKSFKYLFTAKWLGQYGRDLYFLGIFFMITYLIQGIFKPLYIDIYYMSIFFLIITAIKIEKEA